MKFYFSAAPNPMKIALFLEEAGIEYEPIPVDTRAGDQHKPDFVAINPNGKVPVLVDGDATVFDSSAILLHLGESTGKFIPAASAKNRAELLSWMMFVGTGVGPFSGQAVHFQHMVQEDMPYAKKRYVFEAKRHYGILNDHLSSRTYMVGDTYTIVDMNVWGWARVIPFVLGAEAWTDYPHLKRLVDEIEARPAAQTAIALKDKFAWKAEVDDEARRHMFRHL